MQKYPSAQDRPPTGVPEKEPPPKPEPEITPPPPPQPAGPPDKEKIPNEIPERDIPRTPPDPQADESVDASRARKVAEQDREDVQERSPDLFPDKTLETGDTYDQDDTTAIPEE